MELLQRVIKEQGIVIDNEVLKVDGFLNHRIDPKLMYKIGEEFAQRFKGLNITKILTLESSGIAPAVFTGFTLGVPVVFAKKNISRNINSETYSSCVHSFTKNKKYIIRVSKEYIDKADNLLIIDDFLANGQAVKGMIELATMAGANVVGIGIVIEKGFQNGGTLLREMGIRVESLAIIEEMSKEKISFRKEEEKKR